MNERQRGADELVDRGLPRPCVLVVDDTHANLVAMRRILNRCDVDIVEASNGNAALAACLNQDFALILLDVQMPDMDGLEVARWLSQDPQTRNIPIILVTAGVTDDLQLLRGYNFGAVDFVAKPIDDVILRAKINVFLDLYRGRMELQRLLAILNQRNHELEIEIAERKRAEAAVRYQAMHDPLTGLPNRALFMERAQAAIAHADPAAEVALLYIDLDGFKPVNDLYGHPAGDALLVAVGYRLLRHVALSDTVARLGGDEYAIVLTGAGGLTAARQLADALLRDLAQPFDLDIGHNERLTVCIGASMGLALASQARKAANPLEALIQAADSAMYKAKRSGGGTLVVSME